MPAPSLDIELPIAPAEAPRTHSALAKVLASAPKGHHGLAIDVTDDNRVVGTWLIELHPRDASGTLICIARARLQVCASMCGDARSNNAFLVIAQWPTNVTEREQRSQLYLQLGQAVLARLDTVAGRLPVAARMPPYVLFLVDGRPPGERRLKALNLARLQSELLRQLEGSAVGRQLDLRVAHGSGTGSSPLPPTPAAAAKPDLSAAAQVVWPARARLVRPKLLPRLRIAAHFDLESSSEAEKRHADPPDWKTASTLAVDP